MKLIAFSQLPAIISNYLLRLQCYINISVVMCVRKFNNFLFEHRMVSIAIQNRT